MTNELAKKEDNSVVVSGNFTPMNLLEMAAQRGASMDELSKFMDLVERHEERDRRKAYVAAMSAFKKNPPDIIKNRHVKYGNTNYKHATLDQVVDAVTAALSEHGLSHDWKTNQVDGMIEVTCVITHEMGHSERTTLKASADKTGAKNDIQAIGSTVAYLQRYTLLAATGLAAREQDNDGAGIPSQQINTDQVNELEKLIKEVGADLGKMCKHFKIENLKQLPESNFDKAKQMLEAKRNKGDAK